MSAALLLIVSLLGADQPPATDEPSQSDDMQVTAASASCVGGNGPLPSVGSIQLLPSGIDSGTVEAAASAWNSPGCNTGGTAFPMFQLGPGAGLTVPVTYVAGYNPANHSSCGDHQGRQIHLYGAANDPITGQQRPCSDQLGNLEHELGHMLGLSDQTTASCPGYIMSQNGWTSTGQMLSRHIQPGECAEANYLNVTPTESAPPPPPPPIYCPPDCLTYCLNSGECYGGGGGDCETDPTGCGPFDYGNEWLPPSRHKAW